MSTGRKRAAPALMPSSCSERCSPSEPGERRCSPAASPTKPNRPSSNAAAPAAVRRASRPPCRQDAGATGVRGATRNLQRLGFYLSALGYNQANINPKPFSAIASQPPTDRASAASHCRRDLRSWLSSVCRRRRDLSARRKEGAQSRSLSREHGLLPLACEDDNFSPPDCRICARHALPLECCAFALAVCCYLFSSLGLLADWTTGIRRFAGRLGRRCPGGVAAHNSSRGYRALYHGPVPDHACSLHSGHALGHRQCDRTQMGSRRTLAGVYRPHPSANGGVLPCVRRAAALA